MCNLPSQKKRGPRENLFPTMPTQAPFTDVCLPTQPGSALPPGQPPGTLPTCAARGLSSAGPGSQHVHVPCSWLLSRCPNEGHVQSLQAGTMNRDEQILNPKPTTGMNARGPSPGKWAGRKPGRGDSVYQSPPRIPVWQEVTVKPWSVHHPSSEVLKASNDVPGIRATRQRDHKGKKTGWKREKEPLRNPCLRRSILPEPCLPLNQ